MKHVGVGDDNVAFGANSFSGISRGVAIEGKGLYAQFAALVQFQNLSNLILCQCLGWKHIEGFCVALKCRLQDGQVIAECFARSGRCDHDRMLAGLNAVPAVGLMGIELMNPAAFECLDQSIVETFWKRAVAPCSGWDDQFTGDSTAVFCP